MFKPDAIVTKNDHTIIVIEAKSRPLSGPIEDAVRTELHRYSTSVNSPWAVVIDPQKTEVFHLNQPVARLSTGEVIAAGSPGRRPAVVGESTLLFAFDRWLHRLSEEPEAASNQPGLSRLARDLGREWTLRYVGPGSRTSTSTSDE